MAIFRRGIIVFRGILLFVVLLVIGELLAAALTGSNRRSFAVLSADEIVKLGTQEADLATHAARYIPEIRVDPTRIPPYIETIWYQAIDQGDTLALIYYVDWPNEIHPNPVFHRLYELYRQAFYGSEHDIEYLEFQIDKSSGVVQRMRYETAEAGDYDRTWTVHQFAYVDLSGSGKGYVQCIRDEETGPCQPDTRAINGLWNTEQQPVLGVMTWNHLYELLSPDDYGVYTETVQAPLKYLTDDVYSKQKMARRSQGDLKTQPNETTRNILRLAFWSFGAFISIFLIWGGLRK